MTDRQSYFRIHSISIEYIYYSNNLKNVNMFVSHWSHDSRMNLNEIVTKIDCTWTKKFETKHFSSAHRVVKRLNKYIVWVFFSKTGGNSDVSFLFIVLSRLNYSTHYCQTEEKKWKEFHTSYLLYSPGYHFGFGDNRKRILRYSY